MSDLFCSRVVVLKSHRDRMFIDYSSPRLVSSVGAKPNRIPYGTPKYFAPNGASFLIDRQSYRHLAPPELNPTRLKVLNYLAGSIRAWPASHAATRMGSGAAKIKPLDWSPILRPTNDRTEREELIE